MRSGEDECTSCNYVPSESFAIAGCSVPSHLAIQASIVELTDTLSDVALALFFLIFGLGACFGWETGYAINLARDFGPRLMSYAVGLEYNACDTVR